MKSITLLVYLALASSSVFSAEVSIDADLESAVRVHEAALLTRNNGEIADTVAFPHAQFFPDGRAELYSDVQAMPDISDTSADYAVDEMELLSREGGLALVHVTFVSTGENPGQDLGAAWWCFVETDFGWRILWRHYLGRS